MGDDDRKLSTGRLARLARLASLSARLSQDVVSRGVKRFTGATDGESLLGEGAAEKLVATLGDLKGLAMKLGQQVSMDPDLLSPKVRAVVARLQNQAPPMPWATVREVLSEQLGRPPEASFARFEEAPLASASLGQVHRAWTHDGHEVAVKVQYPGIARALESDLDNVGAMVSVVGASSKLAHGKAYYAEFRDALLDELDYRQEAQRAQRFARAAAGLAELKVPRVFEALTTEKVLTLELLRGPTLKELLHRVDEVDNHERFRVSRLLVHAVWGPFLASGCIHADPHPGNFLLLDDGRVGVLDFGAIKELSAPFVTSNRRLFRALCDDEPFDAMELARASQFGFDDEAAARPFVRTVVDIATRAVRSRDFDFAAAFISRDLRNHFLAHTAMATRMRPPKESVQFFRAIGGLSHNLENLRARGDFRGVYSELLGAMPGGAAARPGTDAA